VCCLDCRTRYYNVVADMFTVLRVVFEYSPTRFLVRTPGVKSFRLSRFEAVGYQEFLGQYWSMCALFVALLYYVSVELSALKDLGVRRYLSSLWNFVDLFHLTSLGTMLGMWVYSVVLSDDLWSESMHCVQSDEFCFVSRAQAMAWCVCWCVLALCP